MYHAQFGFGDAITDIAIRYTKENQTTFRGSNSVVINLFMNHIDPQNIFRERDAARAIRVER
jgi:hypothetical protein